MSFITNLLKSKRKKNYKIGIALSGGGVRGLAHLGILKALNENQIFPDIISGTSAGALAGLFYADGYSPDEAYEIFQDTSLFKFAQISFPRKGLLSMQKVIKILEENIKAKSFDDLKKPLYVATSNLNDGIVQYFNTGDVIEKVIASASVPVVFNPVLINGNTYVDGGIFDNLPIDPIQNNCEKLIASHVNPLGKTEELDSIIKIAERTFHLAIGANINAKKALCDLFIEPETLRNYGILGLSKGKEIFETGYETTMKILEKNNPF